MRTTPLTLIVSLALLWSAVPAAAAVTARGTVLDDHPRASWLDRFAEQRQGPEQVDKVTQTFKVGAAGSLDLSGISGDVRVTGGSGNDITVEATKRVRHRDPEQARRMLADLRVDMTNIGGRVEVRTVYPRNRYGTSQRGFSTSVDYVVAVPAGAAVMVKSISGNVLVTTVRGEVRAETVSGDVEVSATPNVALAKTISGNVTARDIGSANLLSLGTVSGTVIATGLKVRALEAGSVSGDVRISGVQIDRGEVGLGQHRFRLAAEQSRPLRVRLAFRGRAYRPRRRHRLRARRRHLQRQRPLRPARDPARHRPEQRP
jgi:hypothetical protein